jgi:hypothetical protein
MIDLSFEAWIATPETDLRSYDEWVYEDGKPIPIHPLQNAVQKDWGYELISTAAPVEYDIEVFDDNGRQIEWDRNKWEVNPNSMCLIDKGTKRRVSVANNVTRKSVKKKVACR